VPKERFSHQKYIYFNSESPPHTYPLLSLHANNTALNMKEFFNLTMTYRKDSDIYAPYFSFEKLDERLDEATWQRVSVFPYLCVYHHESISYL
jgi:hypothetical protein